MKKTDKKWKPGQLVTLWGKVYRISKCRYNDERKYKTCFICGQLNGRTPCINAVDYPEKSGFCLLTCIKKMPKGCIPKHVHIKSKTSD